MPNWVNNEINFHDQDVKKLLKNYLEEKENEYEEKIIQFDFNKLIPMPDELNLTSGGVTNEAIAVYLFEVRKDSTELKKFQRMYKDSEKLPHTLKDISLYLQRRYKESGEMVKQRVKQSGKDCYDYSSLEEYNKYPTLILLGERYQKNKEDYGFTDWYYWRCKHWGCKWNASSCAIENDMLYFETPWGAPIPIFEKLCELFPDTKISFRWDEEQGYWGTLENENGKLVEIDEGFTDFFEEECEE